MSIHYTNKHKVPFLVDDEYDNLVQQHFWNISTTGYPTNSGSICGFPIKIHLFLFGSAPIGLEWDHINLDKLDNRKINIRAVPHIINQRNHGLRCDNKTGYKGVYKSKSGKYSAQINIEGNSKAVYLGGFSSLEEAVKARKDAENLYWKDQR